MLTEIMACIISPPFQYLVELIQCTANTLHRVIHIILHNPYYVNVLLDMYFNTYLTMMLKQSFNEKS